MNLFVCRLFGSVLALLLLAGAMTLPLLATAAEAEFERGPHNGRLLVDGSFVLELAIFEAGVPPEYRVWATQDGRALSPRDYSLEIVLTRLGGQVDRFSFEVVDDYLRSLQVVGEPHSFDVEVIARHGSTVHRWVYPSHEGRVQLSSAFANEAGLTTAVASPGTIRQQLRLFGQVTADPERVAHVAARFPGIIKSVHVSIGSVVNAGAVLASVEANESLRSYDIVAPLGGVVVARHANPGELAGSSALFTIADYSSLLLNLAVFPQQALQVRVGQQVRLQHQGEEIVAEISVLTPATDSPTLSAHAELDNSAGSWTPGTWVATDVTVAEFNVPLAVDNRALQDFRDWQVVFIKIGDTYEIRPLELGRTDGSFTEVLGGLNPGDTYVVGNSYLIKADLEKSGASHDH
jgi:membrane fusion protein, heavy metal efflux system